MSTLYVEGMKIKLDNIVIYYSGVGMFKKVIMESYNEEHIKYRGRLFPEWYVCKIYEYCDGSW